MLSALESGSVFNRIYLHVCLYSASLCFRVFLCLCSHMFMCVPMLWYAWLCVFVYEPFVIVFVFTCVCVCVPMLCYVWVCVFVYEPFVFVFVCAYVVVCLGMCLCV